MDARVIIVPTVCLLLFSVHVCAVVSLVKSKKLRTVRFYRLALYLSISDGCMLIEYFLLSLLLHTHDGSKGYRYSCMVLKHLVIGTIMFSLLQTLFICFERLNATFTTPVNILKKVTSDVGVALGFILTHTSVLVCYFVVVQNEHPTCSIIVNRDFFIYLASPNVGLVVIIALCLMVVMIRLFYRAKKTTITVQNEAQVEQGKRAMTRMRRNVITLICIVIVAFCSNALRIIYGLYLLRNGRDSSHYVVIIRWTNNLLLLNPLFDPFIYIFRIKELRDYIRLNVCRCQTTVAPSNDHEVRSMYVLDVQ